MSAKSALEKYCKDVWAFRLGGIVLYQTLITGPSLMIVNALVPGGRHERSNLLVLISSMAVIFLQIIPSTTIAFVQVGINDGSMPFCETQIADLEFAFH